MPTTDVQICNLALSYLGKDTITSLSSSTESATACNLFYQPTVDEMVSDREWTFSVARVGLSQLSTTNLTGYDYVYQIPNGCLRILEVYKMDEDDQVEKVEYRREGDTIITDEEAAYLKYQQKMTDPTEFPQYFVEALSYRLAAKMAMRLTSKRALLQDMTSLAQEAYMRAEMADAMNSQERPDAEDAWTGTW